MLRTVRTVIVDEIHAVIGTRRGAHLALSLERLQQVAERPLLADRPVGDAEADRRGRAVPAPAARGCAIVDEGASPRDGPRAGDAALAARGGRWPTRCGRSITTGSPAPIQAHRTTARVRQYAADGGAAGAT